MISNRPGNCNPRQQNIVKKKGANQQVLKEVENIDN